jgi:uncharacterized protein
LRILLDTNVAVAALLWRGKPNRLLEVIGSRADIQMFSSAHMMAELARALTRPAPAKRLALMGFSADDLLAGYRAIVILVEPQTVPRVVPQDPDDDHVIAAAVSAQAKLIVSGDSALLGLAHYQGIDILSAAMALAQIEGEGRPATPA